jgi:hypothetical protein
VSDGSPEAHEDCVRWSRSDFALARRAARERWGVPDPMRTEVLFQAARMLTDPEASHRDRWAASKFLLEADRHDLTEDKLALDRARFELAAKPPERLEARDAWDVIADELNPPGDP